MGAEVLMPRLSDSMEEGTVLRWCKRVGEPVRVGEALVEIETDKASVVYEADAAGTLVEIVVGEGDSALLGAVIARLSDAGADARAGTEERTAARAGAAPRRANGRVDASPVARRLAGELGVELASVSGTGPRGRVTKADIEAAARGGEETAAAPAAVETAAAPFVPFSRMQATVARHMAQAKTTIPDFTLFREVDMGACVELRKRLAQLASDTPSYNDMIVKAAALALREHPNANAAHREGGVERHHRVNVGIAVALEGGLVVPTILDADRRTLGEIAREAQRLAAAVREATITPAQCSGGTFTVSNLGMFGVDAFAAIVNPGQAAILTVGALRRRAVIGAGGEVRAADTITLGLICDHRVLYGADAARFLARICELLERPLSMML